MEHLLAIFAVWILWTICVLLLTTPDWFPPVGAIVVGIGLQALIDPSDWYLGIGIGGAAGFLILVGDVFLVTADAIRSGVLLRLGRRG